MGGTWQHTRKAFFVHPKIHMLHKIIIPSKPLETKHKRVEEELEPVLMHTLPI